MTKKTYLLILWLAFAAFLPVQHSDAGASGSPEALELAGEIMRAAGSENWPSVKRIRFTFEVLEGDKTLVSAKHDWNLEDRSAMIAWDDVSARIQLDHPASGEPFETAFKRWINDTYWLLMPLKLDDPGVKLERLPDAEIDGATYKILQLSFDGVGLTPGDVYTLRIDPETSRVVSWIYAPEPGVEREATWEDYVSKGGLTLSTRHQMGARTIQIKDLEIDATVD